MARNPKTGTLTSALDLPLLPSDVQDTAKDADVPTMADAITNDAVTTTATPAAVSEAAAADPASTNLPPLIDRMREAEAAAKQKAEADWSALVMRLAADDAVSEGEVIAIVQAVAKTLDDLAAAVDRQRRINRLESVAADLPEADAAYQVVRAAQKDLEADHKRRQKEMEAEFKLARNAVTTARMRMQRAQEARSELWRICPQQVAAPAPAVEVQLAIEAALPPCSQERISVMLPSDA